MGIWPAFNVSIFFWSLSTQMTSLPLSAKQAPATRPTYPVPITASLNSAPQQSSYHTGSNPMRILVDYRPAVRRRSGVGEYMHELVRAYTQLFSDRVTVFTTSWKDRPPPGLAQELRAE